MSLTPTIHDSVTVHGEKPPVHQSILLLKNIVLMIKTASYCVCYLSVLGDIYIMSVGSLRLDTYIPGLLTTLKSLRPTDCVNHDIQCLSL